MCVSGNLWSCLKEVKPLVVYDVGRGLALESIQGNWASSRVDLGETELFHMPAVTSVSFLTCVSVLGDTLEFHQAIKSPYVFDGEHGIPLHAVQVNLASSPGEGEVSWFFSSCGGNLRYILELQWEWSFKTCVCFMMSGVLSRYEGHLRNLHEAYQGSTDISQGEAGDLVSLSS